MAILRGYASKTKQITFKFPQFAQFVRHYAEGHQAQHAALRAFLEDTEAKLSPVLEELAEADKCTLEFDGLEIKSITISGFLVEKIRAVYKLIEENPDVPFPTEESLGLALPANVTTVNIKTEFVKWLQAQPQEPEILRLSFPEDIMSIVVTTDLLDRKLLEYSVLKIRAYLSTGHNVGYAQQKLREAFTALKDQVVQSMLREIVSRPGQVVENLLRPTEFGFSFWAHLASLILKEFKVKTDKLPQEFGYCHACYLIGLYNVYFKGLVQREQEVESTLKEVEAKIAGEPFYFTASDIYSFADDKGVPVSKRCPPDKLQEFIGKLTTAGKDELLPEVVKVRTSNKKEFYIHRSVILRLTLSKAFAAAREYKKQYSAEWFEELGNFRRLPIMVKDDIFIADLKKRMAREDPLLDALLNFELLYLARKGLVIEDEVTRRIDAILDLKKQALIPLDQLLGLDRKELFAEARLKLPVWKTIPLLKFLVNFLDRILGGPSAGVRERPARKRRRAGSSESAVEEIDGEEGSSAKVLVDMQELASFNPEGEGGGVAELSRGEDARAEARAERGSRPVAAEERGDPAASSGATSKERVAAYRSAIVGLKEALIGKDVPIDVKLKELAEKWNPLVAVKAKQDLIEDVNSFVRDAVRRIRRSLLIKPPDLARVKNLSAQVASNEAFAQIKRKEEFSLYIELYMIKVLGKV